jgi:seryl-tRNA synthetase
MAEVADLKHSIPALEAEDARLEQALTSHLMGLPNILEDFVPEGADEADNELLRVVGTPPSFSFTPLDHVALGEGLGQMDFASAAKLSGARFVVLQGQLARLERALASFMLDIHTTEFGYRETVPPVLVRTQTMTGTGQLPKFEEDLFRTTDDRWLIPTAEVPLTNLVADSIIPRTDLPLRMTAYTPCFRAEAGSAGRDTRGMIRQHQFSKVELVSVVAAEESDAELDRMTACAETILQRLELSYRVLRLCNGDTGFSAQQTLDIEVWLPGQNDGEGMFREISSCSNCGPFQARRMKARTRTEGEKETAFVHTLNGSALALGRCMIALLENGQQEDGSIMLPKALHSYMGTDRLVPSA